MQLFFCVLLFDFLFYRGLKSSHIYFDSKRKLWILEVLVDPSKFIVLQDLNSILPIGRKLWTNQGNGICGLEIGSKLELTLSACQAGEFTCSSGECIDVV